ncbi:MAG: glycosyltransferase [Phycisphaerales bacterium]
MKILHLCTSVDPSTGGPANVLARLTPAQVARGHEVRIVTMDTPDRVSDVRPALEGAGVRLMHPQRPATGPLAPLGVKRLLGEAMEGWTPDVGHIHGLWQALPHVGSSVLRKRGVPYVFRPCGMLDPTVLAMGGALKKRVFLAVRGKGDLNGASGLHFTTTTERDLVAPMGLRPEAFVIPNGIDWSEYEALPERGAYRASSGIGDAPLVVFFSRVHEKKGLDILLPAFAQGAPADARLVLVGPGEAGYVASLEREAARLGIGERVVFTGMIRGADRFAPVVDADLFCLPSYQENFGVAVVEALACGTPVLISDQVNIFQDVVDAGVGRAEPCDIEQTAGALSAMLADRHALREMGARAREWARETYAWTKIVERVDAMYARVTGG